MRLIRVNTKAICEHLEWDSTFFGYRIARATVNRLTETQMSDLLAWCDDQAIDCLYFLADPGDPLTVRLAESHDFRFVDIRVTYERQVTRSPLPLKSSPRVRDFVEQDIPALREIAATSHRDSRFYYDGGFAVPLCDALYETWIEKSCHGWATNVLVAEWEGRPVGYSTCHVKSPEIGQIGLTGLHSGARGKGLGQDLVNQDVFWFNQQGVETVRVVTQGRNTQAQRLYEKCGFLTRTVELWYHRWFLNSGSKT